MILKLFQNLLKKKDNKILGIDIGSSSIKIVQLSLKKGVVNLDTFGEISLSVYAGKEIGQAVNLDVDKTAEALSDLIKESQADAKTVAFAIPLKSTLMFNLTLPKNIEREKLNEVVLTESRKYIPVPLTEVKLDWSILPAVDNAEKESEFHNILVVAIHKETLNKYANIASKLDLNLSFLEVETFSTIRSVIKHERNSVAIVDIGAIITKFYVVERGIIRKSNIINIGFSNVLSRFRVEQDSKTAFKGDVNGEAAKLLREDIKKNDNVPIDLIRIIEQIKKAIVDYQTKTNRTIQDVVFTGGGAMFQDMLPYVKKELSVNVMEADPFSKVYNPAFLDDALREAGPEFAVAVGVALRGLR